MKEHDIRPREIFDRFLELARQDASTFFDHAERIETPCPACGARGEPAFDKHGFAYALCPDCATLFVSPRPAARAFRAFYADSPSARFWAEVFYPATAEARRERIWRPKAAQIDTLARKHLGPRAVVADIGGGYGLFAQEVARLGRDRPLVIEPSLHLARACREAGLEVVEKFLEDVRPADLPESPVCFVSFELMEHLHDPGAFLAVLGELMGPDDIFAFTTLSGTGADILALWDRSPSVSPPHHVNFFNPDSARRLLARNGFKTLEVTTPGQLDVSIMENNRHLLRDRFWRTTLAGASDETKADLQQCLRRNLLSSHMLVTARKAAR